MRTLQVAVVGFALLSILELLEGVIGGIGMVFLGGGFLASGDADLVMVGGMSVGTGLLVVILSLLFGGLHGAVAWGLNAKKSWARTVGMVAGALAILSCSLIGIAVGALGIWILMDEDVVAELSA